jgi:integrase
VASDRSARRQRLLISCFEGFCGAEGLEAVYHPELIEAFCARGGTWRSSTRGTYRSVLRQLAGSPQTVGLFHPAAPAVSPYSAKERTELWSMANSQRAPWRRRSALALVALGLGAGLRPGEVLSARGKDVVKANGKIRVVVRGGARSVPVASQAACVLLQLSRQVGPGFLFHPEPADRSYANFINVFCHKLVRDPQAPLLSMRRARSSYICDHLAAHTPLRRLLQITGISEVGSLLRYARHVEGAPHSKAELRLLLAECGP